MSLYILEDSAEFKLVDGDGNTLHIEAKLSTDASGHEHAADGKFSGVGSQKQHDILIGHGYTHEGLHDEGHKQSRHLASTYHKKSGDDVHRVTISDARTKEGKNVGKWQSEHTTKDDYKTAFGSGHTTLKEHLSKIHGAK